MTAKAVLFHGAGLPLELIHLPIPEVSFGQSLIEITHCALCRSDLHTFSGLRHEPTPTILGHEIIGRALISDDTNLIGRRVTWGIAAYCGKCFFCSAGLPQKCLSLFKYGHTQHSPEATLAGGLATHILLRQGTPILPLPERLPDETAVLANCSTATAAAVVRAAEPTPNMEVLVMGGGVLGLTAAAMLATKGCNVSVFDPEARAAQKAMSFGAKLGTGDFLEVSQRIQDHTEGRGFDICLELSGSLRAASQAMEQVRTGGCVVMAGCTSPVGSLPFEPERLVRKMIRLVGVHNYCPDDLGEALSFLAKHHLDFPFASLIEGCLPLSQTEEAFKLAEESSGRRVIVCPGLDPPVSQLS
jgi:putative phosphonate catabolism associated alcohol dehydrogenase